LTPVPGSVAAFGDSDLSTAPAAAPARDLDSLHALRRELEARGLTKKTPVPIILHLAGAVLVALAGCLMTWLPLPWPLRALGVVISVLGMITVGTNSHTSSHRGTSDKHWLNEALTYFGYSAFLGLSATSWINRHVVVHHPAPNVVGVDGDCDLYPYFALTRDEIDRATGWRRFYFEKLQFWFFPVAMLINSFHMQLTGWKYIVRCLRDPAKKSKRPYVIDIACLVAHYALWIALPMAFFQWKVVVVGYVARMLLMSYAMYAVLAPGHFPEDAQRLNGDHRKADFLLLQAASSVNFDGGLLAKWTCSGLQYQVEHHLFPTLSHVQLAKAAPIVREFCERNGLPYNTMSWPKVLWRAWAVLRNPPYTTTELQRAA
jgi:linoleoyl-CoA desaturase